MDEQQNIYDDEPYTEGEYAEVAETDALNEYDEQPLAASQPASERVQELAPEAIRQRSGSRLAIFPLAMGFIGLGVVLLAEDRIEGLTIGLGQASIVLIGALVLTFLFRFFTSGRRERGLFFLAVVVISWGIVLAMSTIDNETFPIEEFWPLTIAGVGIAFFMTFLFERNHQTGLVFPGIILLFTTGILFIGTLGIITDAMQDFVRDYWPLALAFLGLTLLPAAFQD